MAFNDTLFQLGMDLTRSSTAQTEDIGEAALHGAQSDETGSYRKVKGQEPEAIMPPVSIPHDFAQPTIGTHVTIDIHGDVELRDLETAVATLKRLIDDAGASLQHLHVHPVSEGDAVSGVAVLANGHISFHSRPAADYAALDISTFGGLAPHVWTLAAKAAFDDARISVRVHSRGEANVEPLLTAVLPPQRRSRAPARSARARAAA